MSEKEFFEEQIPLLAEMVLWCRNLTRKQYIQWKSEWLKCAEESGEQVCDFVKKVLIDIEAVLAEEKKKGRS